MSRRWSAVAVLLGVGTAFACGGGPAWTKGTTTKVVETPEAERYNPALDTVTPAKTRLPPEPPPETLVQIFYPKTGTWDRVLLDGRRMHGKQDGNYQLVKVNPKGQSPRAKMAPDAVERVQQALVAVDFRNLPADLPEEEAPGADTQPLVFSIRPDSGRSYTVSLTGSLSEPESLGPLAPLYAVLQDEVFGSIDSP